MKWLLIIFLTCATIVIQLFLFWIIQEKNILDTNKKLMHSELTKIVKLESLDKQVRDILLHTQMPISDKKFARKKLLTFFDAYKTTFNLSIDKYFKKHNGMLYLQLTANLSSSKKLQNFLELFNSSVLMEIKSMRKHNSSIEVKFNAFYPFKEYL